HPSGKVPRELSMARLVFCDPAHGFADDEIRRTARLCHRNERTIRLSNASLGCVLDGHGLEGSASGSPPRRWAARRCFARFGRGAMKPCNRSRDARMTNLITCGSFGGALKGFGCTPRRELACEDLERVDACRFELSELREVGADGRKSSCSRTSSI